VRARIECEFPHDPEHAGEVRPRRGGLGGDTVSGSHGERRHRLQTVKLKGRVVAGAFFVRRLIVEAHGNDDHFGIRQVIIERAASHLFEKVDRVHTVFTGAIDCGVRFSLSIAERPGVAVDKPYASRAVVPRVERN
jgi:hypothetical protein